MLMTTLNVARSSRIKIVTVRITESSKSKFGETSEAIRKVDSTVRVVV